MTIGMCLGRGAVSLASDGLADSSKASGVEEAAAETGVEPGLASREVLATTLTGLDPALTRLLAVRTLDESDFWCFLDGFDFLGDWVFFALDPLLADDGGRGLSKPLRSSLFSVLRLMRLPKLAPTAAAAEGPA
jgi:hypothetical protein